MKFQEWLDLQADGVLAGDAFDVAERVWNAAKSDVKTNDKETIGRDCSELLDISKYFKSLGKHENAEFLIDVAGRISFIFDELWRKK